MARGTLSLLWDHPPVSRSDIVMALLVSAALLAVVTIPMGIALFFISHHEYTKRMNLTGGDGLVVLVGVFLIVIVAPVWAFLAS